MATTSASAPFILYGIKNCDTVKKARRWLEENGVSCQFHDYRVEGLDDSLLQNLIDKQGWEAMLNTRGTTWRKLDETTRAGCDNEARAKAVLRHRLRVAPGGFVMAVGVDKQVEAELTFGHFLLSEFR